jgi:hypothetical protein
LLRFVGLLVVVVMVVLLLLFFSSVSREAGGTEFVRVGVMKQLHDVNPAIARRSNCNKRGFVSCLAVRLVKKRVD